MTRAIALLAFIGFMGVGAVSSQSQPAGLSLLTVGQAECSAAKLGSHLDPSIIGEPVSMVTLLEPRWVAAAGDRPAYCSVDGVMAPVDRSTTAQNINFRVLLPAEWNRHAVQFGGGGMNGTIPNLTGNGAFISGAPPLTNGYAVYGSDSGHQSGSPQEWALNDEAMKNLGYMQMKKTHDAAMAIVERMYGSRPRFNYYAGTSQGGREALTVAERYPADYDGIIANVPIVNFSSLMLGPELIRIQEKPMKNWVTPAKVNAIRGEFMRQCDRLDGLVDGIINNYMACRGIFDVTRGARNRNPWIAKHCPNDVDPNPADTSANACLTSGQISTLKLMYSPYRFATPLANGVTSFGMWVQNTDPSGSGQIVPTRFRGQEGAENDAPLHSHLGILGVTGFLMRSLAANPLDYVEGGPLNARRVQISEVLDSTNADLRAFERRGGRLIVTVGTNDTLASPGSQLDYYQSVIDKMGAASVDRFARFFVIPQASHGLSGTSYSVDGDGRTIATAPIPNSYDRFGLLQAWVERGVAPGKSLVVTAGDRSLPLCSYPTYPRFVAGPQDTAGSYTCARP